MKYSDYEDASSNPARGNEFFIVLCSTCRIYMDIVFHISEDGSETGFKQIVNLGQSSIWVMLSCHAIIQSLSINGQSNSSFL